MKVLVINAGSSSLKYQMIMMDNEEMLCKGIVECIGADNSNICHEPTGKKEYTIKRSIKDHTQAFNLVIECLVDPQHGVIKSVDEIVAIGHRFVNGGEAITQSVYVDAAMLEVLEACTPMAPLHNPSHVACLKSCQTLLPNVPNVAVFDTGFHSTMPKVASMYGIPYEDYEKYHFRRYGAHGTSHKFVAGVAREYLASKGWNNSSIVTCHLGNGSSITAVKDGKCIDTSMGMTPLAGVMMGTRCGDIDPALVEMLADKKNMTAKQIINYLNKESGFLGISGVSSDARTLLKAIDGGNERARLAVDMFAYQIKKYIGSYSSAMNGLDCIVFAGGIGENSHPIRQRILKNMEFFGVNVDFELNANCPKKDIVELSLPDSKCKVLIIKTNEELVIARDTKQVVEAMKA